MKSYFHARAVLLVSVLSNGAWAASPVVSNVIASQRPGTKLVDILYDVADADGGMVTVEVNVSSDGGLTYLIPANSLTGAVGAGVSLGLNRQIVWNAGADWGGNFIASTKIRVTAHDGTPSQAPFNMAYVPAGIFQMGDNLDGTPDAPVHNVFTDAFFIDKYEVTKELWQLIQTWGNARGYSISGGFYKSNFHPAIGMTWFDAVKWCNARSEYEGLQPCYFTDEGLSIVYKTGTFNGLNTMVNWSANGYRLPTEAEWEKAARGGKTGERFPWGNTEVSTGQSANANYNYPGNPWRTGTSDYTSIVGSYPANGYGIFDVIGNLPEWVWDRHATSYSPESDNPRGPVSGTSRVLRGGEYGTQDAIYLATARRGNLSPSVTFNATRGFRTVRKSN